MGLTNLFEKLFLPIVEKIEVISKFLVKTFIRKARHRSLFVTKEEIKSLVREIEKQGDIDRGEKEAIEEVFELKSDKIKDFCLGIKKVAAFDYIDTYSAILNIVKEYRFTRYPVFKNRVIVGYVNIYELFYNPGENWQALIRPILKVGLNQNLQEVFTGLTSKKESMALVLKGNRVYGIITIQDIIREITTAIIRI